jgi:hypothetical protein
MLQVAPAARLAPQLLAKSNEEAFAPTTAILVNEIAAPPVLVTVTACDALVVPTFTVPNARLLSESASEDVRVKPVPLNTKISGELLSLSVMVTDATAGPTAVGWKWVLM